MAEFKNTIKSLLYSAGFYSLRTKLQSYFSQRLVILMYHDLGEYPLLEDGTELLGARPSRDQFAAQVELIAREYRVQTVKQAMAEFADSGRLESQTVAITFDDGYGTVYDIAYPILKRHGLPATVYVLTDWVNGNLTLWWEGHYAMFRRERLPKKALGRLENLYGAPLTGAGDNGSEPRNIARRAECLLRELPDDRRAIMLAQQADILDFDLASLAHPKALSWPQIKELQQAGWEIGGHSQQHINLALSPIDTVRKDLEQSTAELHNRLGASPAGFAYTYGRDRAGYARIYPLLEELGYEYACTAFAGSNDESTPRFALHRSTVPSTTTKPLIGRSLALDFTERVPEPVAQAEEV